MLPQQQLLSQRDATSDGSVPPLPCHHTRELLARVARHTTAPKGQTAMLFMPVSLWTLYGLWRSKLLLEFASKKAAPLAFSALWGNRGVPVLTHYGVRYLYSILHSSGPLTPAWCARPCCSPAFIPHPCRARSLEYMPHPKVLTHRRGGGQL